MKPSARLRISLALALAMLATLLTLAPPAAHAALVGGLDCTTGTPVELWAKTGTRSLPPSTSVNVWGYAASSGGGVSIPDTVIVAKAGVGCTVTLHNTLGRATALDFQGQGLAPDLTGIAPGADGSYTFTPQRPGTYLYEAGLLPGTQYQVALGMVGVMIVRPADWVAATAQSDQGVGSNTDFTDEAVIVLGEVDPALNGSAAPWTFDLRTYAPRYFTINGEAYPNTAPIGATAGTNVLLRYVNAGLLPHSMGTLGLQQRFVSSDGGVLTAQETEVARSIAPGETADGVVALPADAAGMRFPLYDQSRLLHNANAGTTTTGIGRIYDFGGMMTFIEVSGSTTPPATGPKVSNIVVTPDPAGAAGGTTVDVTATASGAPTDAELYLDASGGTAISATSVVTGTGALTWTGVDISALTTGSHQVIIRATDGTTWGSFSSENFTVDRDGPAVNALTLSPNPTNGTVAVALSGTANDTNKGGSNISNVPPARYRIDGGAWEPLDLASTSNPISALGTSIPAPTVNALADGDHSVEIEVSDALGNVGTGSIVLVLDRTAPTSTTISTLPNGGLTNGKIGVDAATQAIRLIQNFADPGDASNVKAAEAFIDVAAPVNGSGIKFLPSDGGFDSPTEMGYVDIPLSTITQLTDGIHVVKIHARDTAGNWNTTFNTVTLVVDKAAPAVTTPLASPNPTNTTSTDGATFTVTTTATDPGPSTGIYGAEWFDGADPGLGHGTPMVSTTIPLGDVAGDGTATESFEAPIDYVALGWAPGNHTISVRTRDGAGSWSPAKSVVVNVVYPNAIFADGFESGSAAAWSSSSNSARLSFSSLASMGAGSTQGLVVALCPTASSCAPSNVTSPAYVTDSNPFMDRTYHARFHVNPNNAALGNRQVTILAGYRGDPGGPQAFRVEARRTGNQFQVRMAMNRTNGGTLLSNWINIGNQADNSVEVTWLSSNAGGTPKLQISVNGAAFTSARTGAALTAWNNAQTGAYTIESVRLGVVAFAGSGSVSGRIYFDAFASTRRTVIGA